MEKEKELETLKDEDMQKLLKQAKEANQNKASKTEVLTQEQNKQNIKITKKKKKSKATKIISIVLDILIIPVIILAFCCTILTFSAKANNKVPSFLGMSIVTVLTGSMNNPSHPNHAPEGTVLVIKKVDPNEIKVGDCVAFYAPSWLGSPFTEKIDGKKYSRVIYHQVVRIIYAKSAANNNERVRHFVLRGITNTPSDSDFVPVPAGEGDYVKQVDGSYKIQPGGNFVAKLQDLTYTNEDDLTVDENNSPSMSTMQYATDDLIVGKYDSAISAGLGSIINFCGSTKGILFLVIIPALGLTILTIVGLTKEVKKAKEEDELENEILESDYEDDPDFKATMDQINAQKEKDKAKQEKELKKAEEKTAKQQQKAQENKTLTILKNESKKAKQNEETVPTQTVANSEEVTPAATKEDKKAKVASIIDSVVKNETKPNGQKVKTEVKVEESPTGVKTTTTTKTVTTKKTTTTTKVVEPVEVKQPAAAKAPAAPKAAPAKAVPTKAPTTAPKAAPAAPKAPAAPAKAVPAKAPKAVPVAPKVAPKVPAAPKAAPKAMPKKDN